MSGRGLIPPNCRLGMVKSLKCQDCFRKLDSSPLNDPRMAYLYKNGGGGESSACGGTQGTPLDTIVVYVKTSANPPRIAKFAGISLLYICVSGAFIKA